MNLTTSETHKKNEFNHLTLLGLVLGVYET